MLSKIKFELHADDFGRSNYISRAILKSINKGIVRGVSVIVNTKPNLKNFNKLKKNKYRPRLSLHLNLTEGFALSQKLKIITNSKHYFNKNFIYYFFAFLKKDFNLIKKETANEINNQIQFFRKKFKIKKINLDSHNHVHMIPWIFDLILKKNNLKYIKYIRIPNEKFYLPEINKLISFEFYFNLIKFFLLKFLSKIALNKLKKINIENNISFVGVLETGHMTFNGIKKSIENLNFSNTSDLNNIVEILIHPGHSIRKEKNLWKFSDSYKYFIHSNRKKELLLSQNKNLKKILS